jgi:hypothetical protein
VTQLGYVGDQVRLVERVPDVIVVPQPAAGAEWSVHVPNGELWDVLSIRALYTAAAVAASRVPAVVYTTGEVEYMRSPVGKTITTGVASVCCWLADISGLTPAGLVLQGALPPARSYVPGGHFIQSLTEAKNGGDQWSGIAIYCHRITEEVVSTDVIDSARPMDLLRKVRG